MGNACGGCCHWIFPFGAEDSEAKRRAALLEDDPDAWLAEQKVPLVSARYDCEEAMTDLHDDECVVTKQVVMRSPRATHANELAAYERNSSHHRSHASTVASSVSSNASNRSVRDTDRTTRAVRGSTPRSRASSGRGLRPVDPSSDLEVHGHGRKPRSSSAGSASSASSMLSPCSSASDTEEIVVEQLPQGTHHSRHSRHSHAGSASSSRHEAPRTTEVEICRPTQRMRRDGNDSEEPRARASDHPRKVEDDDHQAEAHGEEFDDRGSDSLNSSRSPRSRTSSSASPRHRSRYGRKNYRASSSRKKNA